MAQQQRIIVTDDIDGSEGAKPYQFAWQGTGYAVDLTDAHRDDFLRAIAPYIDAARKTSGRGTSTQTSRRTSDAATVREWARAHGYAVPDRGRIPSEVRAAYDQR